MTSGSPFLPAPAFEPLLACGTLKTWSVIVTILGDLAAQTGARISGPVLTALTEPMGLRPEALRVAIHRLRRDGWITSERDGRTSLYGLTAHGLGLTRSVSARVYGAQVTGPESWRIVVAPNAETLETLDLSEAVVLSRRVALLPGEGGGQSDGFPDTLFAWRAEPGALPEWVRELVVPADMVAAYQQLSDAVEQALRDTASHRDVINATALRLLALHNWRRLVLRHGAGAEALLGGNWPGAVCRARIVRLLDEIARPETQTLGSALVHRQNS